MPSAAATTNPDGDGYDDDALTALPIDSSITNSTFHGAEANSSNGNNIQPPGNGSPMSMSLSASSSPASPTKSDYVDPLAFSIVSVNSAASTQSAASALQSVNLAGSIHSPTQMQYIYNAVKSDSLAPGDLVHLLPVKFFLQLRANIERGVALPGIIDYSTVDSAVTSELGQSNHIHNADPSNPQGYLVVRLETFEKIKSCFHMHPTAIAKRNFVVYSIIDNESSSDILPRAAKVDSNPIRVTVYRLPANVQDAPLGEIYVSDKWTATVASAVAGKAFGKNVSKMFSCSIINNEITSSLIGNNEELRSAFENLNSDNGSKVLIGVTCSDMDDSAVKDFATEIEAAQPRPAISFSLKQKETPQQKRERILKRTTNAQEEEEVLGDENKKPLLLLGSSSDLYDPSIVKLPSEDGGSKFPGTGYTLTDDSRASVARAEAKQPKSTAGVTGLNNLGNTCFMNSALQCLSNCAPLTEYFLSDKWKEELNVDNPLGMGGMVARAYASLVRDLWIGQPSDTDLPTTSYYSVRSRAVAPRNFKSTIGRFNQTFLGYSQQDSQELLQFLLDGLHEDLNRILKKPYVEQPDMSGRPDDEIATKAWELYRLRNDSQIVDLFQGEYKSRVECVECANWSVTFDPYMFLSLPVPERREVVVSVVVVPSCVSTVHSAPVGLHTGLTNVVERMMVDEPYSAENIQQPEKPRKVSVTLPRDSTIQVLKSKIADKMGRIVAKNAPGRKLVIVEVHNHHIYKVFTDYDRVSEIQPSDVIYAYELMDSALTPVGLPDFDAGATAPANSRKTTFVPVYLRLVKDDKSNGNAVNSYYYNELSDMFGVPLLIPVPCELRIPASTAPEAAEHVSNMLWRELAFNRLGAPVYEMIVRELSRYSHIPLYHRADPDQESENIVSGLAQTFRSNVAALTTSQKRNRDPKFNDEDEMADDGEVLPENSNPRTGPGFEKLVSDSQSVDGEVTALKNLFRIKYLQGETDTRHGDIKDSFYRSLNVGQYGKKGYFAMNDGVDARIFRRKSFVERTPEDLVEREDDILIASCTESQRQLEAKGWVLDASANGFAVSHVPVADGGKGKGGNSDAYVEIVSMDAEIALVAEFHESVAALLFGEDILNGYTRRVDAFEPNPDSEILQAAKVANNSKSSKNIELDNCLQEFMKEEVMGDEDTWYCPKCKEHKKIKKKLDIWSVPEVLVLHLKRFSQTGRGFRSMSSNKIDALVNFPVNGLDLTDYVIGRDWMRKQEAEKGIARVEDGGLVYDLFAVSNHYGGLGGGHYTAFAKNELDGEWYNFDDASVTKVSGSSVVTAAAYMLFYRRRTTKDVQHLASIVEEKTKAAEQRIPNAQPNPSPYQPVYQSQLLSQNSSPTAVNWARQTLSSRQRPTSPSSVDTALSDDNGDGGDPGGASKTQSAAFVATLENPAGFEFGSYKRYDHSFGVSGDVDDDAADSPVHEIRLDDEVDIAERGDGMDEQDMDIFRIRIVTVVEHRGESSAHADSDAILSRLAAVRRIQPLTKESSSGGSSTLAAITVDNPTSGGWSSFFSSATSSPQVIQAPAARSRAGTPTQSMLASAASVTGGAAVVVSAEPIEGVLVLLRQHAAAVAADVVERQKTVSARAARMDEECARAMTTMASRVNSAQTRALRGSIASQSSTADLARQSRQLLADVMSGLERLEEHLEQRERITDPINAARYPCVTKLKERRARIV
ncbi:CSN-associated deubiquitinating enzyme Ubp12 [Entophlyctis luteolus]|nr:CSN-associated deubiquitinating enzyme Ubp12 [Entophlyctis luteolus]